MKRALTAGHLRSLLFSYIYGSFIGLIWYSSEQYFPAPTVLEAIIFTHRSFP
jgi:hypothetical protein